MTHRPASFDAELLAARTRLRAFCVKLTRDADSADDLAQDTVIRALQNWHQYESGTNLIGWLTFIARRIQIDQYRTEARRSAVLIGSPFDDPEALEECEEAVPGEQEPHVFLDDVLHALRGMGAIHYQAIMTAAEDVPYKIAAHECGISEGTYKSRVSRARARLVELCA